MALPHTAPWSTRNSKVSVAVPPAAIVPKSPGFPVRMTAFTADPALTAKEATTSPAGSDPIFFNRTATRQSSPGSTTSSPSPHTWTKLAVGS